VCVCVCGESLNQVMQSVLTLGRGTGLKDCEITVLGTFYFNHDNDDNNDK